MTEESDKVIFVLLRAIRDQLDGVDGRFDRLDARIGRIHKSQDSLMDHVPTVSELASKAHDRASQAEERANEALDMYRRTEARLTDFELRMRALEAANKLQ